MQSRIVVVGDLNGAQDVLEDIVVGTRLAAVARGRWRWTGGRAVLVQIGDVWNRGAAARTAFARLLALGPEARRAGGDVVVLLGNHEVMTALRNEAYCTEAEYLSFATAREREVWPARVARALRTLYRDHPHRGPIAPLAPRLEAWKTRNVPGRAALRRAFGARGAVGREVRRLPIALRLGDTVFAHAGLTPGWAQRGVDGLNHEAARAWRRAPGFYEELPRSGILRDTEGPLWNRTLATARGLRAERALVRSLALLAARRMVVGHTVTDHVPGGERGRIATRFGGRLVCVDVGLAGGGATPRVALVIEGPCGHEWTPRGTRLLWRDRG